MQSEQISAIHAALVAKRANYEQMLWQTPALAIAAQAFLLTIVFDQDVSLWNRASVGLATLVVYIITTQQLLKHSALEVKTSCELEEFAKSHFDLLLHAKPNFSSAKCLSGELLKTDSVSLWVLGSPALPILGCAPLIELIANTD